MASVRHELQSPGDVRAEEAEPDGTNPAETVVMK